MIEKSCILGVDDDAINQLVLKEFLGDAYDISLCSDGLECLDYLEKKIPDVILMDVSMPGLSGLETCERLRKIPNCAELPVIFVSALASKEDKMAGYQAGGDDYLTKPFEEEELKSKIDLLLAKKERSHQLKESSENAFKTAMLSMENAGELGVIIEFLTKTHQAKTPTELAKLTVETIEKYGHQGSVLLTISDQTFFVSSDGEDNSVEQKVMEKAKDKGRIIEYGSKLIFNGVNVSLLARNMVFGDDRIGRLRDHLAIILDGLETSLDNMSINDQLDHSLEVNKIVKRQTISLLEELKQSHKDQQIESATIFSKLHGGMETIYHQLGLSDEQEKQLNDLVLQADSGMSHLFEFGQYLDEKFKRIITELDG